MKKTITNILLILAIPNIAAITIAINRVIKFNTGETVLVGWVVIMFYAIVLVWLIRNNDFDK